MVQRSTKTQTTVGGVVLAALIAIYGYAQPVLNQRYQWNLPSLPMATAQVESDQATATSPPQTKAESAPASSVTVAQESKTPSSTKATESVSPERAAVKPGSGPLAGRVPKPASTTRDQTKPTGTQSVDSASAQESLRYGLLKDLGDQRYVSPAGLLYTRGSAEGHRLDHLERHTVDDPNRPGKHGVFDGGMAGALKTIDRAYERAKTGQRTTKQIEEGRVVYTVDMGGRVGYIGGQDGNRTKKPMARRVRIVLDQQRVITAFPL